MERQLPRAVIAIVGLVMLIDGFFRVSALNQWATDLRNWNIIIMAFALGIGAVNLVLIHAKAVAKWQPGKSIYSLALLTGLVVFASLGITRGTGHPQYRTLFDSILVPANTALFGTLIFFIVSAAYRAFMLKSRDSMIIFAAAAIVIISQVPLGETILPVSVPIATWLQDVPNNAGQRGLIICAALGAMANSLRVLVGVQRTY